MGYGNISPSNCFKGGQETNCRINALIYATVSRGERVHLWFHATADYKELEAKPCSLELILTVSDCT